MMEEAVEGLKAMGPRQGSQVVLHQDLHGGNILSAQREPWLMIDPKPLVGELDFDAGAYLRDRREDLEGPDGPRIVQRRIDMLAEELPIDRRRARLWGMAHLIAWGGSDGLMHGEMLRALELIWRCK
jgi:streptomycin 6-kinase